MHHTRRVEFGSRCHRGEGVAGAEVPLPHPISSGDSIAKGAMIGVVDAVAKRLQPGPKFAGCRICGIDEVRFSSRS